ncbi:MAG: hypothetical protein EOM68_00080 [Spirochaetia bacterium]|nr:hypothetical protein [Spirochaetia bacterium]
MGLVSQSIKNLKSGISQQPDILRFPEQGAEQVNGWSSETQGLKKRPPTIFDKVMGAASSIGTAPLVHMINRDESEQYNIVFTGNGIRAFKLDGTEIAVTGDMSYVTTANPRDDLRMVTVADYTFVTNKTKNVANRGDIASPGFRTDMDAIVSIRGGQYGRTFSIYINGGLSATFTTPDGVNDTGGAVADQVKQTDAQFIVNKLHDDFVNRMGSGWGCDTGPGFMHIYPKNSDNIRQFVVQDGYANQLAVGCMREVQSFAKLPLEAPDGYTMQVVGDTSKSSDAFYVRYNAATKVWHETLGWNTHYGFDKNTMPHVLVRQANGTFDFHVADWADRAVGDDNTNPDPSFIGSAIHDIFFFRNRLGFISGENIIMGRTGNYFKFFPASVANTSDDDPIDVAVSHNRISILKYAVPFSEQLLLWSDQAQFILSADGTMSAKTVSLDLATEFDVSDKARPCGLGRGVYFASPRAQYSTINRYYAVQDVSDVKNAEDVTSHVPSYVENGVYSIAGSTTENYVCVLTSGAKNRIYMYKFLYLDEAIRQQSWSHWEFPEDVEILSAEPIGSTLYIMARNSQNVYMTHVNFTKETIDFVGEPYQLYIDIKKPYTIPAANFNPDSYQTSVNLRDVYGMGFAKGEVLMVDQTGLAQYFAEPVGGWANNTPVIYLDGDWSNKGVFFGRAIQFRYVFSKFLIKTMDQNGFVQTQDLGRLQLRRGWLNYVNSGSFDVDVVNANRTFTYGMTGKRLGSRDMVLGALNVATGQFRFSCCGEANSLTVVLRSNAPTPLNVVGAGWEGNFVNRAQGI